METEEMDPAQVFEAKLIARLKPVHEVTAHGTSAIQQFYSGATVFVTGGSGFLGKQLIEKLLRATKIAKIFVLLRCKKGKPIKQRLSEMLQDPLYDMVREQQPDFAEKIVPVSGDMAELRLAISEEDWNTITEQVDIVIHMAATTRFDEPLRAATLVNLRGTRETLVLGKACKKLRSFVYVSTAYTQACKSRINTEVFEEFSKSPIAPHTMIQIAETVDEGRINDITPSLINNWPNTYSFVKAIAEDLVNSMSEDLPMCVVRPTVVVPTIREPIPGWVDMSCMYGGSGMFTALGLGVMHTGYFKDSCQTDLIPVDYVNNAILAAAWETAKKRATVEDTTKIYTVTSSRNTTTLKNLKKYITEELRNYPTPMLVSYGFCWYTSNPNLFWIFSWLLHLIPAYIADGVSVIVGNKRRFVKLASKLYKMTVALSYFSLNEWNFNGKNTAILFDSLSAADQEIFNFDAKNIDWKEYVVTWGLGLRKYILKDGLKGTIYARKKQAVLKILTYIIVPLYFYCLFKILCVVFSLFTLFW